MWKIIGTSARGDAHIKSDLPCQDHHHFEKNDNLLVAIVCDGAGSAKKAEIGAQYGSEFLSIEILEEINNSNYAILKTEQEFRSLVESKIESLREKISSEAAANQLQIYDYHATLVGMAIGIDGGYFFHIGDGAAIALNRNRSEVVAYSKPENGEFSDQTYFYTVDDWKNHLRITPIKPEASIIMLMSDGTMPFCLNKTHDGVEPKFFVPLDQFFSQDSVSPEIGSQALHNTLSSDRANLISKDDKTLIWISSKYNDKA